MTMLEKYRNSIRFGLELEALGYMQDLRGRGIDVEISIVEVGDDFAIKAVDGDGELLGMVSGKANAKWDKADKILGIGA